MPRPRKAASKMTKSLGERLRATRKLRGLTQERLSELSRVEQPLISRIERGHDNPPLQELIALARALDISLDWLAGHRRRQPGTIIDILAALCPQDLDVAHRILEAMVMRTEAENAQGRQRRNA